MRVVESISQTIQRWEQLEQLMAETNCHKIQILIYNNSVFEKKSLFGVVIAHFRACMYRIDVIL